MVSYRLFQSQDEAKKWLSSNPQRQADEFETEVYKILYELRKANTRLDRERCRSYIIDLEKKNKKRLIFKKKSKKEIKSIPSNKLINRSFQVDKPPYKRSPRYN